MQDNLTSGYLGYIIETTTEERPSWIAPVGVGFRHIYDSILANGEDPLDPDSLFYRLYTNDGSHPSLLGAYLSACVFYGSITGESPIGLSPPSELTVDGDQQTATALQGAAHAAVFDHLEQFDFIWEGALDSGDTDQGVELGDDTDYSDIPTNETCGCSQSNRTSQSFLWLLPVISGIVFRRRYS
jgi:hypothetical protein